MSNAFRRPSGESQRPRSQGVGSSVPVRRCSGMKRCAPVKHRTLRGYTPPLATAIFAERFRKRYRLVRPMPSICDARTRFPLHKSSTR